MIYTVSYEVPGFQSCTVKEAVSYLSKLPLVGLDLETTGFFPKRCHIISMGFGDQEHQFIAGPELISDFMDIFMNKELVGQNLLFDYRFLYEHGVYPERCVDTYLNENLIYNGYKTRRADLGTLIHNYIGIDIDKEFQKKVYLTSKELPQHITYLAQDVRHLSTINSKQQTLLAKHKLLDVARLEYKYLPALAYCANCGFKVDIPLLVKKVAAMETRLLELTSELNQGIIDENIEEFIHYTNDLFPDPTVKIKWSNKLAARKFFEHIGIIMTRKDKKTKTQVSTLSSEQLGKMDNKHAKNYAAYSEVHKQLTTYGKNILDMAIKFSDSRLRTTYTQITQAGRTSSGRGKDNAISGETGTKMCNLQNFPHESRDIFIAEEGHSFIIADYAQQEPRITAEYSSDPAYYEYCAGVKDMHCFFVQCVYPETRELSHADIKKKYAKERTFCKQITFAMAYLGSAKTIFDNTGLPIELCKEIEEKYYATFNGVKAYYDECLALTLKYGYILINEISGRKRFIPEVDQYREVKEKNDKIRRQYWESKKVDGEFYHQHKGSFSEQAVLLSKIHKESVNTPIQGTAADMTKLATIYLWDFLKEHKLLDIVKFNVNVHDELVFEAPDDMIDLIKNQVRVDMIRASQVFLKKIPMELDVKVAKSWIK